jgi:hypothetical protein
MKKKVILFLVFSGIFLPIQRANANVLMKLEDVSSMQINRTSGGTRTFNENDSMEEFVIRKIVEWINTASPVKANWSNQKHFPSNFLFSLILNDHLVYFCTHKFRTIDILFKHFPCQTLILLLVQLDRQQSKVKKCTLTVQTYF